MHRVLTHAFMLGKKGGGKNWNKEALKPAINLNIKLLLNVLTQRITKPETNLHIEQGGGGGGKQASKQGTKTVLRYLNEHMGLFKGQPTNGKLKAKERDRRNKRDLQNQLLWRNYLPPRPTLLINTLPDIFPTAHMLFTYCFHFAHRGQIPDLDSFLCFF